MNVKNRSRRNHRLLMLANPRRDALPQIARRQLVAPFADRLRQDVVLRQRLVIGFAESSSVRSYRLSATGVQCSATFLFSSTRNVCRARCSCDFDVPGETPRMPPISS